MSLYNIKNGTKNIWLYKSDDESYDMLDLCLNNNNNNKLFGYKDSDCYYDIDVKKILLIKNGYNKHIIRHYDDVNERAFVPLQLKIKFFLGELHIFTNNGRVIPIHSDDKELFIKYREVQNTITKLIDTDYVQDFVETTNNGDEFIMVDVHKNTSAVEIGYKNKSRCIIVLHSVSNDCIQASLVQHIYTY